MDRPERLIVSQETAEAMLAHARAELPNEACGLVAGDHGSGRASRFHAARNEHASPVRFSVHAEDLVRLVLDIEARGEDLLAIFHSHVASPAVPSAADIRGATAYPGTLHLLASPLEAAATLRAWRIDHGASREVELLIG